MLSYCWFFHLYHQFYKYYVTVNVVGWILFSWSTLIIYSAVGSNSFKLSICCHLAFEVDLCFDSFEILDIVEWFIYWFVLERAVPSRCLYCGLRCFLPLVPFFQDWMPTVLPQGYCNILRSQPGKGQRDLMLDAWFYSVVHNLSGLAVFTASCLSSCISSQMTKFFLQN